LQNIAVTHSLICGMATAALMLAGGFNIAVDEEETGSVAIGETEVGILIGG